jgi:hypothetical protein
VRIDGKKIVIYCKQGTKHTQDCRHRRQSAISNWQLAKSRAHRG